MTRDELIKLGYETEVIAVDNVAPDFAQRACPDPTVIEFTAHHSFLDPDGYERVMTAYYYQDKETLDALSDGDLGELDWTLDRYEVS